MFLAEHRAWLVRYSTNVLSSSRMNNAEQPRTSTAASLQTDYGNYIDGQHSYIIMYELLASAYTPDEIILRNFGRTAHNEEEPCAQFSKPSFFVDASGLRRKVGRSAAQRLADFDARFANNTLPLGTATLRSAVDMLAKGEVARRDLSCEARSQPSRLPIGVLLPITRRGRSTPSVGPPSTLRASHGPPRRPHRPVARAWPVCVCPAALQFEKLR